MFIDTSVFVAIFAHEDDAGHWMDMISSGSRKMTSALVMLEAVMRLSTILKLPPTDILSRVETFIRDARIEIIPIEAQHGRLAVAAFSAFGKGRSHPARLNLADCLSYACAKSRGIPLLYKGNDFSRTDLG